MARREALATADALSSPALLLHGGLMVMPCFPFHADIMQPYTAAM